MFEVNGFRVLMFRFTAQDGLKLKA